ncbi:MAG: DUF5302 domain-containing protein [Haloechinothrix sp.]
MSESQQQTESSDDSAGAPSDVKQQFREALERKQASAKSGAGHEDAGSKINHAHGPVAGKRQFRRKSG